MQTLKYEVRFLTPAFLGSAEQSGQWRTPPFKALLRQWWRVARAKDLDFDHSRLREEEGRLFGHAWLERADGRKSETWAMQSRVRLRLDSWDQGKLGQTGWPKEFEKVATTRDGRGSVRSDLYLGFGPIERNRRAPGGVTPKHSAIGAGGAVNLIVRASVDDSEHKILTDAFQLMHWFGALGSRSRNGWGSVALNGERIKSHGAIADPIIARTCRPLAECLEIDWPHAIGLDAENAPLVWIGPSVQCWEQAMDHLARVLVAVRRAAKDYGYRPRGIGAVNLIGYPSGGKWKVDNWRNDGRFASPLRFKVIQFRGELRPLVFHMPCGVPRRLRCKLNAGDRRWLEQHQDAVWKCVHESIDNDGKLERMFGRQEAFS